MMRRVRSALLTVAFVAAIHLASPSGAVVLDYQGFTDASTVGMGAGVDLLVGTADDVAIANFNTGGDLAHNFTFNQSVTGGAAFTSVAVFNDAPDLGSNGTSTIFTADGVSVDNVSPAIPFFYEDDASQAPHSFTFTQNGREFSYAYTVDTCATSDPTCAAPFSSIDYVGSGLIMLPADNPTTIYNNATSVKAVFDAWVPQGQGDVPAYLAQLAGAAPATWAAISLAVHSFQITDGVNCTGPSCAAIDGDFFVGVIPTYTLPEPTSGAALFTVLGAFAALARRKTRGV